MSLLLDVRDKDTKRLLFQYDPIKREVWIKPKNGQLRRVSLSDVERLNDAKIQACMSTQSTDHRVP